ncbi:MAG: MBL fold metallo-hydrolase, partial [Candidatus Brockarchaeota archaeon]|nr:MBL fold metallo-hydrolase [Candidatus Brockarchaeota archaeon]
MIIRKFEVGQLQTNCYLLVCPETRQAIVIDPGFAVETEVQTILGEAEKYDADIKHIVNTHWHPDHTSGDEWLKRETGALVLIHKDDAPMLMATQEVESLFGIRVQPITPDATLTDGSTIVFGKTGLRVVHTPGHTEGSVSLLNRLAIFTGDTLFAGSVGRTDLPGGSFNKLMDSIWRRLMILPDETKIYPGHGPSSTIAREKKTNP